MDSELEPELDHANVDVCDQSIPDGFVDQNDFANESCPLEVPHFAALDGQELPRDAAAMVGELPEANLQQLTLAKQKLLLHLRLTRTANQRLENQIKGAKNVQNLMSSCLNLLKLRLRLAKSMAIAIDSQNKESQRLLEQKRQWLCEQEEVLKAEHHSFETNVEEARNELQRFIESCIFSEATLKALVDKTSGDVESAESDKSTILRDVETLQSMLTEIVDNEGKAKERIKALRDQEESVRKQVNVKMEQLCSGLEMSKVTMSELEASMKKNQAEEGAQNGEPTNATDIRSLLSVVEFNHSMKSRSEALNDEVTKDLKTQQQSLSALQNNNAKLKRKMENECRVVKSVEAHLASFLDEHGETDSELQTTKRSLEFGQQQLQYLAEQSDTVVQQENKLRQHLAVLEQELQTLAVEDPSLSAFKAKTEFLTRCIAEEKSKLRALEERKSSLDSQLAAMQQQSPIAKERAEKVLALENQLKVVLKEADDLEHKTYEMEAAEQTEIDQLNHTIEQLSKKINCEESNMETFEEELRAQSTVKLNEMNDKLESMNAMINPVKEEVESLQKSIDEAEDSISKLRDAQSGRFLHTPTQSSTDG